MTTTTLRPKVRNDGIDLLRLVSMLYVVMLHVLGTGGLLRAAEGGSGQYYVGWFLEMWVYCAVNIFGVISGYVAFSDTEKPYRYASYPVMWLQVVFYGVLATVVTQLAAPALVTKQDLLKMCLPLTNNLYWYFSAYTALFFLIPVLNAGIRHCSRESLCKLFAVICLLFSFWGRIANCFGFSRGYSFAWLTMLYLLGAIMKKCGIGRRLPVWAAFAGIGVCTLLSWLWKIRGPEFTIFEIEIGRGLPEDYVTITNVAAAMLYVIAFSKLKFGPWARKLIAFAAPGAFAVYLLNCQQSVWDHVMTKNFAHLASLPVGLMVVRILAFSCGFVAVCVILDFLRRKCFDLLRIPQLAAALTRRAGAVLSRLARWMLK